MMSDEDKKTEEKQSRYGPYTNAIIEHFKNPKNMGEMENPDASAKVGSPMCGDELWVHLKISKNPDGELFIEDIKFQSFGCAAAIATGSMITELAKGKTLKEALKINRRSVDDALGGLPKVKIHCSLLASDALHEAIYGYYKEHGISVPEELEKLHEQIQKGTAVARSKQSTGLDYC